MVEMAAPTWAKARARAGPHLACVRAHVQVGVALSTESAPFYRMARFLGILWWPRRAFPPSASTARACRAPVARLSRAGACRAPVARLPRARRPPVARPSPACRARVARLSRARQGPDRYQTFNIIIIIYYY